MFGLLPLSVRRGEVARASQCVWNRKLEVMASEELLNRCVVYFSPCPGRQIAFTIKFELGTPLFKIIKIGFVAGLLGSQA